MVSMGCTDEAMDNLLKMIPTLPAIEKVDPQSPGELPAVPEDSSSCSPPRLSDTVDPKKLVISLESFHAIEDLFTRQGWDFEQAQPGMLS
jgi:hypothetical protein